MKTTIIYASYTGTTHGIAEQIRDVCGGELIEVKSRDFLSRFVAFMGHHSPGMNVRESGNEPGTIDIAGSDLIVIGTPVWGGKPVPAIRKTIAGLQGCEGKPVIVFATCGKKPGATLDVLTKALAKQKMNVTGQVSLNTEEIKEGSAVKALLAKIQDAGKGS